MSGGLSNLQLLALCAAGLALFVVVTAVVGSAIAMMNPPPDSAAGEGAAQDDDDPRTAFLGLPEPRWVWPVYLAIVGASAGASALWPMGWAAP